MAGRSSGHKKLDRNGPARLGLERCAILEGADSIRRIALPPPTSTVVPDPMPETWSVVQIRASRPPLLLGHRPLSANLRRDLRALARRQDARAGAPRPARHFCPIEIWLNLPQTRPPRCHDCWAKVRLFTIVPLLNIVSTWLILGLTPRGLSNACKRKAAAADSRTPAAAERPGARRH